MTGLAESLKSNDTSLTTHAAIIDAFYDGSGPIPQLSEKAAGFILATLTELGYTFAGGIELLPQRGLLKTARFQLDGLLRQEGAVMGPLFMGNEYRPNGIGVYTKPAAHGSSAWQDS